MARSFRNRWGSTSEVVLLWFAAVPLVCAGCGGESGGRISLEGTVTFDGKPIPVGTIAFRPSGGTRSPSAGCEIVEGRFSLHRDKGVLPGEFRVEIQANRTGNKTVNDPLFGPTEIQEQYIPPRYNTRSELTIEVTEHQRDPLAFELKSE
jgi:hypothetical protein